jgi:outer membrane biosynthesis protein TonB
MTDMSFIADIDDIADIGDITDVTNITNNTNTTTEDDSFINISDKKAFFFGLGVSHSQINLIWMDFIEVVIIYIYLDLFSYSIYQTVNTIGRARNKTNKINYYNLYLNSQVRDAACKMTEKEYKKHSECMKYNFDLAIMKYQEFKYYMENGKSIINIKNNVNKNDFATEKKKEENNIMTNTKTLIDDKNNKKNDKEKEFDYSYNPKNIGLYYKTEIRKPNADNDEEENNLKESIQMTKTMIIKKSSILANLNDRETASNKIYEKFRQFIYLSIHNVILIFIIIISMMISGLISSFYLIFSLYFLITSTRIYLGNKYYYPKAIKRLLRITILLDISLQIIYQTIDTKKITGEFSRDTIYKILEIIGLNKILSFSSEKGVIETILDIKQMALVLAKAFIYLFMSLQVLVYSSQNFQEYYLSYIITRNNNLRRAGLMNVFKFNNKRIEVMGQSIKLRQDMSKEMDKLQKTLEKWNDNIMKYNKSQSLLMLTQNELDNLNIQNKDSIIENDNDDSEMLERKDTIQEAYGEKKSEVLKTGSSLLSNLIKMKSSNNPIILEESEELDKNYMSENLNIDEIKEDNKNKLLSTTNYYTNNLFMNHPFKKPEDMKKEYVPEEKVIENIKSWLLGGFLIKLLLKLHKYAVDYNNISKHEKDIYEKETIQGKIETTSFIENIIDVELKTLDLSHFTLEEMPIVKTYFDGTRAKTIEKNKKGKEINQKFKKGINLAMKIGKITKKNDENPKRKVTFNLFDKKNQLSSESPKTNLKKTRKRLFSLRRKKKGQEKEQEKYINLNVPKFLKLEKFMKNKIFVKYLKPGFIIMNILKDCNSFCSNNFHWVCYITMIINHIMSSSILSLFYPLSIFCYALLEYPRPKRGYWSLCFVYTVLLSMLKFFVQLKFISGNLFFSNLIQNSEHYKLGLKICTSTFSKDFFMYIVFDYLVIIILLINDFLLVFRGLFLHREQEIENIYQAMKRISITKDLALGDLETIRLFNDSFLLKEVEILEKFHDIKKKIHIRDYMERGQKKTLKDKSDNSDSEQEQKKGKRKLGYSERAKLFTKSRFKKKRDKGKENDEEGKDEEMTDKKGEKGEEEEKDEKKEEERKEEENKDKERKDEENKEKDKKDKDKHEKHKKDPKYDETQRSYFQTLFPKIRNEKPGNEYYVTYTLIMFFIILYLLFFYTRMVQDKTYGAVTVETKQFSGAMVMFLILHVAFLVYDRIIFISQNRNNLSYEYILYDKVTKKRLTELEFNQIKSDITKEYPNIKRDHFIIPPEYSDKLKEQYNIVYIQTEEFNMPLFNKYILHMVIVIFGHIFVFFFMPMCGNVNLNTRIFCLKDEKECNDFLNNKVIIIFYCLYVIYFIFSGLQIKYGFYDMKRKSVLKSKSNSISGGFYNGYKNIPFLYEIKLAIDWTFTGTCLDIFQWNKFESIYDIIYTTNCSMTGINSKPVGQEIGKVNKFFMGGLLSFALVVILIGPIIIFSSLNPLNTLNNLTSADLKVELCFGYKNKIMKNYTIYRNSKPQSIDSITQEEMNEFHYSKASDTRNFPVEQIQTVTFFEENDRNWELSRPHINKLIGLINERNNSKSSDNEIVSIDLVLEYSFYRLLPPESQHVLKRYNKTIFEKYNKSFENNEKMELLESALANCYDINITYENIYSPPIRLKANSHPKRILNEKYFKNLPVQLGFVGCKNISNENRKSYLESYFIFSYYNKNKNKTEGIKFHIFSDQVSSTTLNYSVLTFYVGFVLVAGNYIRNFFSGQSQKISLTEMPHNEELLTLCEGIKVSRYSSNYEEEEKLYYILIEIMRSPDYLRLLTSSSIDQYNQRLIMNNKNCKTSDDVE